MSEKKQKKMYLKLRVHKQQLLLPLQQIQLVLRLPELHPVPSNAKEFEGILNYHGKSVPVYNMGTWIENKPVKQTIDSPLILCKLNNELIGLLTSDVDLIMSVHDKHIQRPNLSELPSFVGGIYEYKQASLWVLNLDPLLNIHESNEGS